MATYYWVGGSGNWDATSTTNWASSSGGSGGAGVPTSADDVIFDAGSNVGTGAFTVTITGTSASPAVCRDFSTGGAGGALDGAMTLSMGATAFLDVYGSLTLPAINFTWSGATGARLTFKSTTTGKTITTNGVTLTGMRVQIDGVGGEWTLGSAITWGSSSSCAITNGTLITANYNMSGATLESSGTGTRALTLGSSTITLSGSSPALGFSGSNFTLNAGTSTISCSAGGPTFTGGGYTFYNVTFTSTTSANTTISGANTFNNLTVTTPAAGNRRVIFDASQTVSGTLTLGAANTAVRRVTCLTELVGSQRTLTVATLATLSDVDFRDIKAAGASSPWSGTRIGDCGGNADITFTAASDKYWYSATGAGGNWSAAQWETTSGGTSPSVNNFPLPQDTVKFQDAGLSSGNTITIDAAWNLPAIDGSARTLAMTLASAANIPSIFGDFNIPTVVTITGTGVWSFRKQGTQNITTNGVSLTWPLTVENATGSLKLLDNLTVTNTLTLTSGGLDINNLVATCNAFSSTNANTRSVSFGTGKIAVTANNTTVVNMTTMTNFSYTGTPVIEATYSGSTGTRTVTFASAAGGATEANAISLKVSAGADTVSASTVMKDLDTTGFSGTLQANTRTLYGNLTLGASTIYGSSSSNMTFAATSGTQTITSNGVTVGQPIVQNSASTVRLSGNLTTAAGITGYTLTAGTLDLFGNILSVGSFASTGSSARQIVFGTSKIVCSGSSSAVVNMADMTNFSYTGTPLFDLTYSGSTGTRTVSCGSSSGATESNVVSVNVSAGADSVLFNNYFKNIDTTGFSGSFSSNPNGKFVYGNFKLSATTTYTPLQSTLAFNATSGVQTITTNGVLIDGGVLINAPGATVRLVDALTLGTTRPLGLTAGKLDLNGQNCSCGIFTNSGTSVREITFGAKSIIVTGNNTSVLNMGNLTNFTYTGTGLFDLNYSGATGTRTIAIGSTFGSESNAVNLSISAGSDVIAAASTPFVTKNLDTTGFSGTFTGATKTIYGNLTLGASTVWSSSSNVQTFAATSGTQTVTTNGVTIDSPVTINTPGATVQLADAITVGATRTFTLSAGTLKLKNGTTNTAGTWAFTGTVSNPISLQSTSAGSQATISEASGTVDSTYLTVKDIVATGGATFNAFTGTGSVLSNNNVNNGNNRGWFFIPPGASFIGFF